MFEVGDDVEDLPPDLKPLGAMMARVGKSPGRPMKLEKTRPWFAYEKESPHRVRAIDFSRELTNLEKKVSPRPGSDSFRDGDDSPKFAVVRPMLELTDTDLELLLPHDDLLRLSLCNTKITDAGLVHLRHLKKLRVLDLSDTHVRHLGAGGPHWLPRPEDHPNDPPLDELTDLEIFLVGGQRFCGGLDQLTELKHLKILHFMGNFIGAEAFVPLSQITSLEEFRIGMFRVDGSFLRYFAFHPNLETLQIHSRSFSGQPEYFRDVAYLDHLKHLDLGHTPAAPMEAISHLEQLEELILPHSLQDDELGYLAPLKQLRSVRALRPSSGGPLSDGMRYLTGLDALEIFELRPEMTRAATRYLNELPSLKRIQAVILNEGSRSRQQVDMRIVDHPALEAIDFRFRVLPGQMVLSDCPALKRISLEMEPHYLHSQDRPHCHLSDLPSVEEIVLFPNASVPTQLELVGDLGQVRTFRLGMQSLSMQQLTSLERMKRLEHLELLVVRVPGTTRMLKKMQSLAHLKTLKLAFENPVNRAPVRKLLLFLKRTPKLEHLTVNLNRQPVPLELFEPITELENLRTLELIHFYKTELGDDFFRKLPNLRWCKINGRAIDLPKVEKETAGPTSDRD